MIDRNEIRIKIKKAVCDAARKYRDEKAEGYVEVQWLQDQAAGEYPISDAQEKWLDDAEKKGYDKNDISVQSQINILYYGKHGSYSKIRGIDWYLRCPILGTSGRISVDIRARHNPHKWYIQDDTDRCVDRRGCGYTTIDDALKTVEMYIAEDNMDWSTP